MRQGGTRRAQANSTSASTTPGAAAIHVRSRPNSLTVAVANMGPSAQPIVPPVIHSDRASARRDPQAPARDAVCGWKAETPTPPSTSSATSAAYECAAPMLARNTAATSGPHATNQGRARRSASRPNSGCENEEDIEPSATSPPTMV